jgi:hypothetical protein
MHPEKLSFGLLDMVVVGPSSRMMVVPSPDEGQLQIGWAGVCFIQI